jgi:hypothetical protein
MPKVQTVAQLPRYNPTWRDRGISFSCNFPYRADAGKPSKHAIKESKEPAAKESKATSREQAVTDSNTTLKEQAVTERKVLSREPVARMLKETGDRAFQGQHSQPEAAARSSDASSDDGTVDMLVHAKTYPHQAGCKQWLAPFPMVRRACHLSCVGLHHFDGIGVLAMYTSTKVVCSCKDRCKVTMGTR